MLFALDLLHPRAREFRAAQPPGVADGEEPAIALPAEVRWHRREDLLQDGVGLRSFFLRRVTPLGGIVDDAGEGFRDVDVIYRHWLAGGSMRVPGRSAAEFQGGRVRPRLSSASRKAATRRRPQAEERGRVSGTRRARRRDTRGCCRPWRRGQSHRRPGARRPSARLAFLYRALLDTVRRRAAVDGALIDPWQVIAKLEGLGLRRDRTLGMNDRLDKGGGQGAYVSCTTHVRRGRRREMRGALSLAW